MSLQAINPRLIYCSITGYGQTGPLAHKAGYDFAIQAEGGLMSITGNKGEEPQKVGVAVTDLMTGVYATTAILAALHERARTGKGRVIDAALFDVQVAMLANQASNQLIGNKTPTRMGNAHPNIVPYQVFPTRDGHMVLAVGNDGQFAKFCDAAGQPAVSRDARFSTNPARVEHRATLVPLITGWTMHERHGRMGRSCSTRRACPAHRFLTLLKSWNIRMWRRAEWRYNHAMTRRPPPMVANPMLFDGQRPVADLPPPALDAHQARWLHTS